MLRRTRSSNRLTSPIRETSGTKRKNVEDAENLPSPPSTPTTKRKTKSVLPETPQNVRNITKELQLAQLKSPSNNTSIYLKSKKADDGKETLYQKAKGVFRRTAIPSRLIGRGNERMQMMDFWKDHVLKNEPGCLYISGMPGTGKTAMLTEVMRLNENQIMELRSHQVKTVVINCMSVREPKQIYMKLIEELSPKASIQSDIVQQAHDLINLKKNILNVVILDEIDSLITRDQDVLYKIFEWASLPSSRLVLIGIANALDLTDRILPRLRAKNCEPQLLNFNPYQVSEISNIIKDRLFSLVEYPENPFGPPPKPTEGAIPPLMMPSAIEFCARKVASSMGDLRTALDVCRQAIELAEMDQKKKKMSSGVLGEQKTNTTPAAAAAPKPMVTVAHVSRVLQVVFGNSNVQKLKQLNLQQKIVLGVIIIMIRTSTTKANKKELLTVGRFREQYSTLCSDTSTAISAVSRTELSDLLSLLETQSILTLGKSKEDRTRKIELNVQESEIIQMIQDVPILKTWMDEVIEKSGF